MLEHPDYQALVAGQARIIEEINSGAVGLPLLTALLEVAQRTLNAVGVSFAEYGLGGGHIIAATDAVQWALGCPVGLEDSKHARLLTGPRTQDVPAEQMPGELAGQLRKHGLGHVLVARTELGGTVIGTLHVHYRRSGERGGPEHHAVLTHLASCIAHFYGHHVGPSILDRAGGARQHHSDDDRDLFLAVTSHELRTPVTVIKGYADTLNDHWDSLTEPDRRQAARVIGQRARELARLVERLLSTTVAASTVGGSPPVPFDLAEALRAAVGSLPADLRQRLRLALPDDLPAALGDPASVTTVLTELVTNAEKYSPPGSPIEVAATADEGTVLFRVRDRGIGVRPEHVERAFERFWQGEPGDRRRYPGVGLGLYLVRTIVERQNGWVSLRPHEKEGTVAEVRLPRG